MKSFKLASLVLSLHAFIIAMLVLQPGCKTLENVSDCYSNCSTKVSSTISELRGDPEHDTVVFDPSMNAGFEVDPNNSNVVANAASTRQKPSKPAWTLAMEEDSKPKATTMAMNRKEVLKPIMTAPEPSESQPQDLTETYSVKSGDSLWKIAKKKGTTIDAIIAANDVTKQSVLKVGQKLVIPTSHSDSFSPSSSTPAAEGGHYLVKQGDTLSVIAQRFGVSTSDIQGANNMRNNTLYAGKKIIIPGVSETQIASKAYSTPAPKKTYSGEHTEHQVASGETLSVIAMQYGVALEDLMEWNNISDARKLRAGQNLLVKGTSAPQAFSQPSAPKQELAVAPVVSEEVDLFSGDADFIEEDSMFDLSEEIPVVSVNTDS